MSKHSSSEKKYLNPLYKGDFPDPFVWKFAGEYWAICTGFWHDGGVFGVLCSRDLINWTDRGSAINPIPLVAATCYWAPEVFYENGRFYLYYSVGNEELMTIRVAIADHPGGKYVDSGHRLTNEQFAIDSHVFADSDGTKYLFYATDFLEHSHIGTGTVRDKMLSLVSLSGNPQPVTRAKFDWQVYDPARASKGGVRWHTIEGSAVLKRKKLYYQMFSGGNWQNISYGVSYATTSHIEKAEEWRQVADDQTVFPILRTVPDKVIGPGHNSVVRGTDNRQLYCVYHRWAKDLSGRQMAIDKLDFAGERMFVLGASYEPQTVPNPATLQDFFDVGIERGLGQNWESQSDEEWVTGSGEAVSNPRLETIETNCRVTADAFLVEVSARAVECPTDTSSYGFCLKRAGETVLRCLIVPGSKQIELSEHHGDTQFFQLPPNFEPTAFHLWRVEVDNFVVRMQLDEAVFKIEKQLKNVPQTFALATRSIRAAFAGFALTVGFENLFDWEISSSVEQPSDDLARYGWQAEKNFSKNAPESHPAIWKIENNFLQCESLGKSAIALKQLSLANFEFVVNARLSRQENANSCYGFVLRDNADEIILTIKSDNENYFLHVSSSGSPSTQLALPDYFNSSVFHQFRFRLKDQLLQLQCENVRLGEVEVEAAERQIGLCVSEAKAVFDMVRVTAI